jgi:hypothetical protein
MPVSIEPILDTQETRTKLEALNLHLNSPEPLIICRVCKYALQPTGRRVLKHLWETHKVPLESRQDLNAVIKRLALPDVNTVEARKDGCAPHPYLVTSSGVQCKHCNYRSTSLDLIKRHLSAEQKLKGRDLARARDHFDEHLSFQAWTQNGKRDFWIVQSDYATPHIADNTSSPRRLRRIRTLHLDEQQHCRERERLLKSADTGVDGLAFISNWMRRTRWAVTFAGVDRTMLLNLCRKPVATGQCLHLDSYNEAALTNIEDDEECLLFAGWAVDHFFDRCEDTERHTHYSLRCWLRSHIPGRPYKSPFEIPGRKGTRTIHRALWKRLIFFVLRLHRLTDETCETQFHFRLSKRQRKAIDSLWNSILQTTKSGNDSRTPLSALQTSREHASAQEKRKSEEEHDLPEDPDTLASNTKSWRCISQTKEHEVSLAGESDASGAEVISPTESNIDTDTDNGAQGNSAELCKVDFSDDEQGLVRRSHCRS